MIARLGDRLTEVFKRSLPDPFIFALLLTLVAIGLALGFTDAGLAGIVKGWRGDPGWDKGFFAFLAFSMQMCLVLVTGHALAEAPLVKRLLRRMAEVPRSSAWARC
jgi:short-chain fatty acids transporter